MTLINADQIDGETVSIEFFNPDKSPRGRVDLTRRLFDQTKGFYNQGARRNPHRPDNAKGTGLYYAFNQGEGFLSGPATTVLKLPPRRP